MNISSSSTSWPQRPDPSEFFKKADGDGSGGISKDELATTMKNRPHRAEGAKSAATDVDRIFSEADADGDGEINETENTAWMEKMGPPPMGGTFNGSSGALQSLLDGLAAKDGSASQEDLVAQLIAQLKQDRGGANLFQTQA